MRSYAESASVIAEYRNSRKRENKQIFPVFTFGTQGTDGKSGNSFCVHIVSTLPGDKWEPESGIGTSVGSIWPQQLETCFHSELETCRTCGWQTEGLKEILDALGMQFMLWRESHFQIQKKMIRPVCCFYSQLSAHTLFISEAFRGDPNNHSTKSTLSSSPNTP